MPTRNIAPNPARDVDCNRPGTPPVNSSPVASAARFPDAAALQKAAGERSRNKSSLRWPRP